MVYVPTTYQISPSSCHFYASSRYICGNYTFLTLLPMNSLFPHIDKIEHLRSVDGRMAQLVERFGYIERPTDRPLFEALVESIVGQQVATPLAERTMTQLRKAVGGGEIVPQAIARLGIDGLAECGISNRKAEWLVSGAARFEAGEFEVFVGKSSDDCLAATFRLEK